MFKQTFCLALFMSAATSVPLNSPLAQSDTCAEGYVWREAFVGDHVCVSPDTRDQAKLDNANAHQSKLPGRDECVEGLVWRLANPDDHVCVPQITREQAAQDNSVASSRLASRHSERFPPEKRTALPLPPARVGCHVFRDGQWVETRCATEEETKRLPPPTPALSIRNGLRLVQIGGRTIIYRAPIRFGEIDIEIESNPALGRVTDVVPAGV
ncbi:MAG: hypothetical protein K0S06_1375, partial [Microvirga sp.]|nr:hypothetical protein [Microvirga sp.]